MKQLFVALLLVISTSASAQISVGGSAGYTRAWQNYGDVVLPDDAVTHIHAFNADVQVYYQVHPFISLGIEPGLSRLGAACVPGWNGGINPNPIFPGDSRFLLDYIEAPLMIQGNFKLFQDRFFIQPALGYGWSVMVKGREEVVNLETGEVEITREMSIGEGTNLSRWDHGFHGTLKLGWQMGKHSVFSQSGYYFGLRDAEAWNTSKNRALSVNLGYSYQF
ncbi:MAG: hypothetical protein NXI10_02205 [bacterium]|nr:hypothetical protein [bacterium]